MASVPPCHRATMVTRQRLVTAIDSTHDTHLYFLIYARLACAQAGRPTHDHGHGLDWLTTAHIAARSVSRPSRPSIPTPDAARSALAWRVSRCLLRQESGVTKHTAAWSLDSVIAMRQLAHYQCRDSRGSGVLLSSARRKHEPVASY